jgi:hypothetical protein
VATNIELTQTLPSADLTRRLTLLEEAVHFVRKKPLGAGGGLIILAIARGRSVRRRAGRPTIPITEITARSSCGRTPSTGSAPTSSVATS